MTSQPKSKRHYRNFLSRHYRNFLSKQTSFNSRLWPYDGRPAGKIDRALAILTNNAMSLKQVNYEFNASLKRRKKIFDSFIQHNLMPIRQMSFLKPIRNIAHIACKFLTFIVNLPVASFQFVLKIGAILVSSVYTNEAKGRKSYLKSRCSFDELPMQLPSSQEYCFLSL